MKRLIKQSDFKSEFQEALIYSLSKINENILKVINNKTKKYKRICK